VDLVKKMLSKKVSYTLGHVALGMVVTGLVILIVYKCYKCYTKKNTQCIGIKRDGLINMGDARDLNYVATQY